MVVCNHKLCILNFRSRSTKCGGRLTKPIDNDDARHFKVKGKHSHAPDPRKLGKKKVMHKVKTLAKTTHMPSRQVVLTAMTNVQNSVAATMRQTVNRVCLDPNAPKNPKNLAELRIAGTKTESGKDFILYDRQDDDDDDSRLIIFGTKENLDFILRCQGLFMDGTFDVAPRLFYQVYTIHGKFRIFYYDDFKFSINVCCCVFII